MKNKTYFILEVTFAILVPVIINAIYFYNVYIENNEVKYLTTADMIPSIIYEENKIYGKNKENVYHFIVEYNGSSSNKKFKLYLKDIEVTGNIKWQLQLRYGVKYMGIDYGVIDENSNKTIEIGSNLKIPSLTKQDYRFIYYIDDGDYFEAKLYIE